MIDRFTPIHDPNDTRIEPYRNQKDAWLKAAHNPNAPDQPTEHTSKDPLFITEGSLVLEHHINSPYPLHSILIDESKAETHADLLARIPSSAPIYTAPRPILDRITGYPIHRGLLAAGRRIEHPPLDDLLQSARALVLLEDLSNHDNLGSVFRSTAALCGSDVPLVLSPRCCDPLYRKSLRVSMGHALTIPFHHLSDQSDWLPSLKKIQAAGFRILAMTPSNAARDINEYLKNSPSDQKIAILLGAEGPGLTPQAMNAADEQIRIPLVSSADSLNISVAAAVALHRLVQPMDSPII
ncbi:MAG: RNA methyltransferase [Phycisphaerales bacterium]|nr:RNA methyltransferase [Phycisphaerales bacterium]